MIGFILEKIKKNWEWLFSGFLWLCIWGGYSTDVSRFFAPGFPHNTLDLIHALRSLLPLLALAVSVVILVKKRPLSRKFFKTPLGWLCIFAFLGLFSSVFSNDPLKAFYWGILYISVMAVLLTVLDNKRLIKNIIVINFGIAGVLA